ncbi:hypothetical protein Ait01nite_087740 [Actinoplanes italicus]|uniref:Uncharacterized protein DUF4232 n=1 Tax=Actinoplanes italicus TaxID=113567 RepID=A0A2T0K4B8_9ACTN|nr:DUF4232 domain-containing protein [Actinoplanes italicus]PRX17723.1 uncharacterized protein DUF4232 [Actinoplanes italicus]GIE35729.1 hypothetical protein Ait01nite_087740 [Actinoplanes italicus]
MTRNAFGRSTSRQLTVATTALLGAAVAVALVGGTRTREASAGAMSTDPGAVSTAGADVDCLTDDLTGTLIGQARAAGSKVRDAVLRLTNDSGRACRVRGWADIDLVTPPGDLVKVPTSRIEQTGGDTVVALTPGASAWALVQWDVCTAGRAGCGVGVTVQYIVDPESTGSAADSAEVPEAEREGITMKALRVGPFQQDRAAALA